MFHDPHACLSSRTATRSKLKLPRGYSNSNVFRARYFQILYFEFFCIHVISFDAKDPCILLKKITYAELVQATGRPVLRIV